MRSLMYGAHRRMLLTSVRRAARGRWVTTDGCYSPALGDPMCLGCRRGPEGLRSVGSPRRGLDSPSSLGMSCRTGLAAHRPSALQLEGYVHNPKKEIGSMKLSRPLGLRLSESQHKAHQHFSFQLDLSCHGMVCTQNAFLNK